jgi:hypothetical protein
MKNKVKANYVTFPIEMLRGFEYLDFEGVRSLMSGTMNYSLFLLYQKEENIDIVLEILGINYGNLDVAMKDGERLHQEHQGSPLASINKDIIFDFYNNEKSDFEKRVFAVYCGLRSILGKKKYIKSNNSHLIARSLGYKSFKELSGDGIHSYWLDTYFTGKNKIRHHLTDKILNNEISLNWGMKYYSLRSRGFYFGFNISLESLVLHVETLRRSNRLKQLKEERKLAIQNALKTLATLQSNHRNYTPP